MRTRATTLIAAAALTMSACSAAENAPDEADAPESTAVVESEGASEPGDEHEGACAEIEAADNPADRIRLGLEMEDAVMIQAITVECPEYEDVMMAQAEFLDGLDGLEELGE